MENMLRGKSVFTTGDLAELFSVNINTVVNWFESGIIKGYKLPGSEARRIPRKEVMALVKKLKRNVTTTSRETVEILLLSSHRGLPGKFRSAIESAFGYRLKVAKSAFEAGYACAANKQEVIFVHIGHADFEPREYERFLKNRPHLTRAPIIAITDKEMTEAVLDKEGYNSRLPASASGDAILDLIDSTMAIARISANENLSPGH